MDYGMYHQEYGGKVKVRNKDDNTMVVTWGFVFGGDVDYGLGGRSDGGDGGDGRDGDSNGRLAKWGGYCSDHNLRYIT